MGIPTIDTSISLTGAATITNDKSTNVIPLTMPTGDSDETETFDMLGVLRTISVIGQMNLGSVAATKAVVDSIMTIADGDQSSSVPFVSDQTGTIQVKISSFSVTWNVPGFYCDYNLKLIEGT